MPNTAPHHEHDWLSASYAREWIESDKKRSAERIPKLRRAVGLLPFNRDRALRVIDLGGGDGALLEEVLKEFPGATVVLHDFSAPMIDAAKERLGHFEDRVEYRRSDMREVGWSADLKGPFDAVISAIAIHNLWDPALIHAVYDEVFDLVAPGGVFFNLDYIFPRSSLLANLYARAPGGTQWGAASSSPRDPLGEPTLENQLRWLREAGFSEVDCLQKELSEVLLCGLRPLK